MSASSLSSNIARRLTRDACRKGKLGFVWQERQRRLLVSATTTATNPTRPSNLQRRNARLPSSFSKSASTESSSSSSSLSSLPYGLKKVDYSKPPPTWVMPPAPPPSKNPVRRYFPTFMLLSCTGLFIWIYFNQDESVYDYWRSVEQGDVPVDDDFDENDDDDEEDLDLSNVDEWEEDGKKK